jgi:hypothetical protein
MAKPHFFRIKLRDLRFFPKYFLNPWDFFDTRHGRASGALTAPAFGQPPMIFVASLP